MRRCDVDAGISAFLGDHKPFRAVVKQHVADFIVSEIASDGTVAELTTLETVSERERPDNDVADSAQSTPAPTTDEEWETAFGALRSRLEVPCTDNPALVTTIIDGIRNLVRASDVAEEGEPKALVLPPLSEKAARKAVHTWIKANMPDYVSDTVEADGSQQAIRLRKRSDCRPWKRRKTNGDKEGETTNEDALKGDTYDPREDNDRKGARRSRSSKTGRIHVGPREFVEFVLWKRNADTHNVLSMIAKRLRLSPSALSHAGTKDKRGVTTQRVRVRGIAPDRLMGLNGTLIRLRGSQVAVIGNCRVLNKEHSRALSLGDLSGNRFTLVLRDLDFSGPDASQNVDNAVDSLRSRGFVNYFGLQRFGSGTSATHETGYAVLRNDFEEVCRLLLQPVQLSVVTDGEGTLRDERKRSDDAMRQFAAGEIGPEQLLEALPRWMNVERSITESYCRDHRRGTNKRDHKAAFDALPRNLRRMYGHAVQSYLWNIMATARVQDSSATHAIAGDIVPVSDDPDIGLSARLDVRTVSEDEENQKSVPISRVLLPVAGSQVELPDTKWGNAARTILTENKVDLSIVPADYDMAGTYRWLVAKPRDLKYELVKYTDPRIPLVDCTAEGIPPHVARAMRGKIPEVEADNGQSEKQAESRNALIISFTLGCAEYATMLIRELTKQDSSITHQKAQQALAQNLAVGAAQPDESKDGPSEHVLAPEAQLSQ